MKKIHYNGFELEHFDSASNFREYQVSLILKYINGNFVEVGAGKGGLVPYYKKIPKSVTLLEPEKKLFKILKKKFDLVYFLSGNSNQETSKSDIYYDLNTTFNTFVNLLEAVKKNKFNPPIWFASSVVVYGSNNKPLKENFDRNPISYYALSKYLCENAGKFYCDNFKTNIGIMRIFSTFGPGLKKLVVYDTIKKIKFTLGKNRRVRLFNQSL